MEESVTCRIHDLSLLPSAASRSTVGFLTLVLGLVPPARAAMCPVSACRAQQREAFDWPPRHAAAVVFTRDVNARTSQDPRVKAMEAAVAEADEVERPRLRVELAGLRADVRSEKLGEVADEFEKIHNIERARAVGSVHTIIPARELRPYLIGAVERGLSRTASDTPSTTSP